MKDNIEQKRGFTRQEKWIIWGVFCLLVGLSTHRFTAFLGLMILSVGINFMVRKQKIALALALSSLGVLSLIFSKYMI